MGGGLNMAKKKANSKKVRKHVQRYGTKGIGIKHPEYYVDTYLLPGWVIEKNKMIMGVCKSFVEEQKSKTTQYEEHFSKFLKTININFKEQFPLYISDKSNVIRKFYIADFYIPELRTIVEIDGGYHNLNTQRKKDIQRTKDIKDCLGLRVIRFTNEQVYNYEHIISTFQKYLGMRKQYDIPTVITNMRK